MSFQLIEIPQFIPEGVARKIERANQNIANLPSEINAFFKRNNYRVVRDTETKPVEDAFRFGEPHFEPAPSLDYISVLCGEIIYHLRSSLDHLIWELIGRNGKDPAAFKRPKPEFPVYTDPDRYKSEGAGKVEGISDWSKTQVFNAQPFPETHNWPLWNVHELNIRDKHRSLNTIASWATIKFRHDGVITPLGAK